VGAAVTSGGAVADTPSLKAWETSTLVTVFTALRVGIARVGGRLGVVVESSSGLLTATGVNRYILGAVISDRPGSLEHGVHR
jgi:hypothetical protein